ncbi:acyl-CoA dehydrogenase family protein [Amycolatopsis acidiphila]|uniref:Acyl-CoA dehydrogenase family protein n=1 Tax=Amycolatopsis acidiphila TaxID=715473 RepID=A0A558A1C2_9PSEU|nr:acyl-CoA dehydrogenase family protein [Amycolatopsis acidiphila]TVT18063.1 acyl-CoA dehydrogenase family protein [Amycolatopsis acidiphila]UIJ56633.1 acyl-CoA dehydrogenase family protein [Amycolatopsis acidiphila]GHG56108.1 acyl-CoA dehydrogenase [Amycolatopsis acidiphila]
MSFTESEERRALRKAVAELGRSYGHEYYTKLARSGGHTSDLWNEAGRLGYLGVAVPEEYGGGGAGIGDLAAVCEEFCAAGTPMLLMVVSPAICATVLARYGTDEQKRRWLPRFATGEVRMSFAITEPDAGSNSHRITTTARRDGADWILNGRKVFISGVDEAEAVLVVGRTEDAKTGKLKPALFIVPTNTPGFEYKQIEMDLVSADKQFGLFLDDVRLPHDALVGSEDAALAQLFAGLNPERIMGASFSIGIARYALEKGVEYAKQRSVWGAPIGSHQGLAHPLAQTKIELELAKLMTQKAAALYDSGDDFGAGEAANMAKYAGAEVAIKAVDTAIQVHGGNGMASEYGLGTLLGAVRVGRIAPVSREMVLNFVAQHSLGLPKSY